MTYELIPGHIYYVKLKNIEYIFEYVKRSTRCKDIIVSEPHYYDVIDCGIKYSPYQDEGGLCRLFNINNVSEIREATSEEARLLGVKNYNSKLKINHKQFKLKFKL